MFSDYLIFAFFRKAFFKIKPVCIKVKENDNVGVLVLCFDCIFVARLLRI